MSRLSLIDPELLAIMQCPRCGGTLAEDLDASSLVCADCGASYPVVDGIPDMVVEHDSELGSGADA